MRNVHIKFDRLKQLASADDVTELKFSAEAERHLQNCDSCQTKLEQITADESWWNRASTFLSGDILDSEYDSVSAQLAIDLEAVHQNELDEHHDAIQQLTDNSILDSASHPEMLGRIGHYDVEKVIGRGGMGVVYKGYDTQLNRSIAIKVLSPHLGSNGTARKRFSREARAAAAVVHPNVIPIHGVNSESKLPFIVMQLVAGQSLQAQIDQNGPMEVKDIIRIAIQIAAGLDAAHKQGLVHRDIKPANILMEDDLSRVMITDFGLARAADDAAMTQTGWLAGTPHYMSPEQARGKSVNQTSDLFSLGSVMYFMATGRVPFRAEGPVAVLNLICTKEVTPIRQVNSDIPRALSNIVEKLLEKHPSDRFRSAAHLHKILEEYLAYLQHPESAKPPKSLVTRSQLRKRSFGLAGVAAMLILLTGIYGAVTWSQSAANEGDPNPDQANGSDANVSSPELINDETSSTIRSLMPDSVFHQDIAELNLEIQQMEIQLDIQTKPVTGSFPSSIPGADTGNSEPDNFNQ